MKDRLIAEGPERLLIALEKAEARKATEVPDDEDQPEPPLVHRFWQRLRIRLEPRKEVRPEMLFLGR